MAAVRLLKAAKRTLPSVEYVEVTPDLAREWLENSRRNRKLSQRRIDLYASAMQRGDWLPNDQGISFNEQGQLMNGQHRLNAVIKANLPIPMLVVSNIPDRSQLVMDQNLKRTPHDQVALREGWEVTPMHIAVAKCMITSVGGPAIKQREIIRADLQLMDRYYVKHHKAVEFAVAQFNWRATIKGVTIAPVIAPVARAYYSTEPHKLARFSEVVATGMADSSGDAPAIVLRNWLLAQRDKELSARRGKDRYVIYKRTELALKAYLEDNSIERLGQLKLEYELFPIPGDRELKIVTADNK